eukprot:Skav211194  [mRNA]  locus=scaffold2111:13398:15097:+ [translate_table: standard]
MAIEGSKTHPGRYFQVQLMIGHDVMAALATTDFKVHGTMFPFVRVAMWCTMCSTDKIQDGFSKILTKADIEKARGQSQQATLIQIEDMLKEKWLAIQGQDVHHTTKCFGRLCVRSILYLTNKQKFARDGQEYASLPDISQAFHDEMNNPEASASSKAIIAEKERVVTDVAKATPSQVALIQHQHLKIGSMYINTKDFDTQVFQFDTITDAEATFVHAPILGPKQIAKVPMDQLYKWKATRAMMPHQFKPSFVENLMYQRSDTAKEELAKLQVTMALHHAMEAHPVSEAQVCFSLHPQGLWAIQEIKKAKALKLIPIGNVSKLKPKQEAKVEIQHHGHRFGVSNWKQYTNLDTPKGGHMDPFWWVKTTTDPGLVNMEITMLNQDGISIPCLTNTKAIKVNQHLLQLKPTEEEEGATEGPGPKPKAKRARKS